MSQVHFEQVTSWEGVKLAHERFVTDYNAQPHWAHRNANRRRTLPLSEGRFAAKCPLSPQKWRPPSSNRKKSFAEIQKSEGKPCRDLDQGQAISTLIEYQGRISIMYAVSRHSAFQAAQRAFRSNRLLHEIGRRNLPRGKKLLPFARKREDNRRSPAEVLGWVTNKLRTPEQLHRIFYATRFLRRLDRLGYAHFRRWKLYGEEALARHPAVIWLHGDALTVEYEETPLAQYTVRYQPDKKHFKEVPDARRFETPYRSPQGWLWELDDTMWKLAKRLPDYAPRKRRRKPTHIQPTLLDEPQVNQN